MAEVSRAESYDVSADQMWQRIGDFGTPDSWHPALESCVREGDLRTLTLGDGAQIVETLTNESPHSYSYRIDESPLPIADYEATISVSEAGEGCEVNWVGRFRPEGASEEEASGIVGGIFDAGLQAL